MKNRKRSLLEAAEYGVDSRFDSQEESRKDGQILMEARKVRISKLTKQDILRGKLMQLKLQTNLF